MKTGLMLRVGFERGDHGRGWKQGGHLYGRSGGSGLGGLVPGTKSIDVMQRIKLAREGMRLVRKGSTRSMFGAIVVDLETSVVAPESIEE